MPKPAQDQPMPPYLRPEVRDDPMRSVRMNNGPVRRDRALDGNKASAFPTNSMYRGYGRKRTR